MCTAGTPTLPGTHAKPQAGWLSVSRGLEPCQGLGEGGRRREGRRTKHRSAWTEEAAEVSRTSHGGWAPLCGSGGWRGRRVLEAGRRDQRFGAPRAHYCCVTPGSSTSLLAGLPCLAHGRAVPWGCGRSPAPALPLYSEALSSQCPRDRGPRRASGSPVALLRVSPPALLSFMLTRRCEGPLKFIGPKVNS